MRLSHEAGINSTKCHWHTYMVCLTYLKLNTIILKIDLYLFQFLLKLIGLFLKSRIFLVQVSSR